MPFVTLDAVYGKKNHLRCLLDCVLDQPTEVHHRQLKDLVKSESQRILYCIHDRNTIRFDTQKRKASIVQTLNFLPNCLAVGSGFIAAGGQGSLLDIRSLDENRLLFSGTLGGAVNNALRIVDTPVGCSLMIHPTSPIDVTGTMLFVCNNDKSIKIFNLLFMDAVESIEFPHPVNYAATDRDAEWLLSVGDSPMIYLHQSTEGGYRRLTTLRGYDDVGMCCAWDPAGIRLAAAGEDGTVCVWDRRHHRKIFSCKKSHACRNVQFSASPMDLLAFSEDSGRVHLLDWRNMSTRQELDIHEGDAATISGISFSPDGKRLFVGTTSSGILGFAVDTVGRRRLENGSFI